MTAVGEPMQEHPVLDVLSATNHGGQAALFVCLVKLLITMSKNQVTCMTLNLHVSRNAKTVVQLLHLKIYRVARDRISGLKAVSNAAVIAKPDDVSSNWLLPNFGYILWDSLSSPGLKRLCHLIKYS